MWGEIVEWKQEVFFDSKTEFRGNTAQLCHLWSDLKLIYEILEGWSFFFLVHIRMLRNDLKYIIRSSTA